VSFFEQVILETLLCIKFLLKYIRLVLLNHDK